MLSAWLDLIDDVPAAVVLNVGPNVVTDWHVAVCENPLSGEGRPHEHNGVTVTSNRRYGRPRTVSTAQR